MSLSALSYEDLLAALCLQYEWGIDAVVENDLWNPLEPPVHQLEKDHSSTLSSIKKENISQKVKSISQRESLLSARSLPDLLKLSEHIEGVGLSRTAMHRLVPIYKENAPFVLVSEVPDADEDRSGVLFSGQAGMLLEKILASVGLNRDMLSIVPTIPWRPPGGQRVSDRDMTACLPLLQRSIALCQPSFVVTMGVMPMQNLLGKAYHLSQVRGRWHQLILPGMSKPVPLFPMRHPLQLVSSSLYRRQIWHDLLILMDYIQDQN